MHKMIRTIFSLQCTYVLIEYDYFIPGLLEDSKTPEKFDGLRKVFIEFAKYAFGGNEVLEIPFYDLLYQTVVEEIAKLENEQKTAAVPLWISTTDKNATILAKDSIPSISDIRNPFGEVEHMQVNYDFFDEFYHDKLNEVNEDSELEKKSEKEWSQSLEEVLTNTKDERKTFL